MNDCWLEVDPETTFSDCEDECDGTACNAECAAMEPGPEQTACYVDCSEGILNPYLYVAPPDVFDEYGETPDALDIIAAFYDSRSSLIESIRSRCSTPLSDDLMDCDGDLNEDLLASDIIFQTEVDENYVTFYACLEDCTGLEDEALDACDAANQECIFSLLSNNHDSKVDRYDRIGGYVSSWRACRGSALSVEFKRSDTGKYAYPHSELVAGYHAAIGLAEDIIWTCHGTLGAPVDGPESAYAVDEQLENSCYLDGLNEFVVAAHEACVKEFHWQSNGNDLSTCKTTCRSTQIIGWSGVEISLGACYQDCEYNPDVSVEETPCGEACIGDAEDQILALEDDFTECADACDEDFDPDCFDCYEWAMQGVLPPDDFVIWDPLVTEPTSKLSYSRPGILSGTP